jgi:Cu(I)/Ag(I) efflux system membrane fusion protein
MKEKMKSIKYTGKSKKGILLDSHRFETLSVRNVEKRSRGCAIPSLGRVGRGLAIMPAFVPAYGAAWRINPSLPLRTSGRTPPQGGNLAAIPMFLVKYLTINCFIALLLFSACSNPTQAPKSAQATTGIKYTCPMHHQILEDHPGSCPICGMTLVKVTGQPSEKTGISLNTVLQPVNSSVISNVSAITPEKKEVPAQITGQGYLDYDSRNFNNITARFSGRIEKLYIKYAFQEIHRGERIFDIYSPDMVAAQQDLIYLNKNSPQETGLISAARQKLLLQGMTDAQVDRIIETGKSLYSLPVYSPYNGHVHDMPHSQMSGAADAKPEQNFTGNLPLPVKEGMYIEKGQTIFNVVDPHRLWAIIKIDRSSVAGLKLNQAVEISFPDIPGKRISGKVNFIEPALRDGDKTTTIRVYLDNMDHSLKVNSIINATIRAGAIDGLWIPRSALLDLGRIKIVWLKTGALYHAHQVRTGIINGNEVQVKSGLSATDSLASNAQYLTDSESFIKTQGNE